MDRGLLAPKLESKVVLAFSLNDMALTADGVRLDYQSEEDKPVRMHLLQSLGQNTPHKLWSTVTLHSLEPTMATYPQKITFGEMRASGVRDVLIYCRDHRCSHHIEISADTNRTSICIACGKRGAEVRPKFSQASMGSG